MASKKASSKEEVSSTSGSMLKADMIGRFAKASKEISLLIRSKQPIIYLHSNESEDRILRIMNDICSGENTLSKNIRDLFIWDAVNGMTKREFYTNTHRILTASEQTKDPISILDHIITSDPSTIACYVLCEFHHYFDNPGIIRRLRNFAETVAQKQHKTIIFLSPDNNGMPNGKPIPPELENIIYMLDWPLPDEDVLRKVFEDEVIPSVNKNLEKSNEQLAKTGKPAKDLLNFNEDQLDKIVKSAKGLTIHETKTAAYRSVVENYSILPKAIIDSKKQIVKKKGLVDFIEPDGGSLEDLGGIKNLKNWLSSRRPILSDDAMEFGCDLPNGLMLLGPWGTGKSSVAKGIINDWGLPGLRIDAAKLMESFVGSSERNCSAALKLAESIAPCVTGRMRVTLGDGSEMTMNDLWEQADSSTEIERDGLKVRDLKVTNISLGNDFKQVRVNSKKITKRKSNDVYLVETPTAKIEITGNHLWPILGSDGSVNWIRTDELEEGMQCFIPSHITPDENDSILSKTHIPERAHLGENGKWSIPSNNPNTVELDIPEELNDEILYLCGLMEADGFFGCKSNSIGLINTNIRLHEIFLEFMCRQFGIEKVYFSMFEKTNQQQHDFLGTDENSEFKPSFSISLYSSILSKYFKNISDNVLKMSPRLVSAWLSGYLDGDGSVNKNAKYPKNCWTNKSSVAQKEKIRSALLRLGIVATGHTFDRVEVSSRRKVNKLIQYLFSYHDGKLEKMANIEERDISGKNDYFNDRSDLIYVPELLKQIKEEYSLSNDEISKKIGGNFSEYKNGIRGLPFARFSNLIDEFNKKTHIASLISNGDFRFVKIVSTKKLGIEDYVYDICNENHEKVPENSLIIENTMLHNCILWFDEVDDLFSGSESSSHSDGGTTSRVIGIISTWMAEHEGLVFNIFTANDISNRPPKLFRKGRIDEIFIVDLPVEVERREIFNIHIDKRRPGLSNKIDTKLLAIESKMFSGAEIREAVNSGFIAAFNDKKRDVRTEDILNAVKSSIPISCTMKEKLAAMRKWQEGRAVRSSDKKPEDIIDIEAYREMSKGNEADTDVVEF